MGNNDSSITPLFIRVEKPSLKASLAGISGALYSILVIVFGFVSFQFTQVRIADLLIPLALFFGEPIAAGVFIGGVIGNFYGVAIGLTIPLDVLTGAVANLLAALAGYRFQRHNKFSGIRQAIFTQAAILIENTVVTMIVGTTLAFLIPLSGSLLVSIMLWYSGLFIGSLIAMNIFGFITYETIRRAWRRI